MVYLPAFGLNFYGKCRHIYLTWPMANLLNFWGFHRLSRENKPIKRLYFRVQDGLGIDTSPMDPSHGTGKCTDNNYNPNTAAFAYTALKALVGVVFCGGKKPPEQCSCHPGLVKCYIRDDNPTQLSWDYDKLL